MSYKIIGIGEVLFDLLPNGPEMGGAPANFACHAQSLGAKAQVITRIGEDHFGREILRRFEEMGLPVSAVQRDPSLAGYAPGSTRPPTPSSRDQTVSTDWHP